MFRTDLLSIIRSLNTVFTAVGICHTGYVDCLLARSGWTMYITRHGPLNDKSLCYSTVFIYSDYHDYQEFFVSFTLTTTCFGRYLCPPSGSVYIKQKVHAVGASHLQAMDNTICIKIYYSV